MGKLRRMYYKKAPWDFCESQIFIFCCFCYDLQVHIYTNLREVYSLQSVPTSWKFTFTTSISLLSITPQYLIKINLENYLNSSNFHRFYVQIVPFFTLPWLQKKLHRLEHKIEQNKTKQPSLLKLFIDWCLFPMILI